MIVIMYYLDWCAIVCPTCAVCCYHTCAIVTPQHTWRTTKLSGLVDAAFFTCVTCPTHTTLLYPVRVEQTHALTLYGAW